MSVGVRRDDRSCIARTDRARGGRRVTPSCRCVRSRSVVVGRGPRLSYGEQERDSCASSGRQWHSGASSHLSRSLTATSRLLAEASLPGHVPVLAFRCSAHVCKTPRESRVTWLFAIHVHEASGLFTATTPVFIPEAMSNAKSISTFTSIRRRVLRLRLTIQARAKATTRGRGSGPDWGSGR